MIIRHIPMKSARLSSFSSLVKYIVDEQNKQERVGKVRISNCNSIDPTWAIQEVLATQARNQRAKGDKTYHLLISFAPGENPPEDILKAIEERVVSSIGFNEHQRISAIHHDTDNLHIHVAVNKIHPKSFNMIEPYKAYRAFAEVASTLEIEYGLKITNHRTRKSRAENLADDMEHHAGIESLINWMKRNCWENLEAADNWDEFHKILAVHDLEIRIKANGFVFCNKDGLIIKASSVSRGFSKKNLECRLGQFLPSPFGAQLAGKNIYRYEPLNKQVIGKEIKISKGGSIDALKKAIEMAQQSYGNCIQVNGSPLFKKIIVQLTIQNNIPITFADPEMESQRQKRISQQEKQYEQSRPYRSNDRSRTARGDEVAGTAHGERS